MNYILSRKPCYEFSTKTKLVANVWYKCERSILDCIFMFANGARFVVDGKPEGGNSFTYKGNNYYILTPAYNSKVYLTSIKYQNKQVQIAQGSNLCVTLDGELLLDVPISALDYKQYEIINNNLIIYFGGQRNYFVIVKDNKVLAYDYYDEFNINNDEVYFLKRLCDSLNHGKVFCLTKQGYDEYLVYLDDYDLNLKDELLPSVMLDLVRAKNFAYASSLLKEDLRPKQAKDIGEFFLDFNDFLPLSNNEFCLLKNDTYLGIVKFELDNGKISNISMS